MHSRVSPVQSCNTSANYKYCMHAFKISASVLPFCDVFPCTLLTTITWFLLQFGVISNCKLFKDHKLHLPYRLVQFCYLWKIYLWLLTPNYTQSHVITYTNKTTLDIPISHFKIESLSCKRQEYTMYLYMSCMASLHVQYQCTCILP